MPFFYGAWVRLGPDDSILNHGNGKIPRSSAGTRGRGKTAERGDPATPLCPFLSHVAWRRGCRPRRPRRPRQLQVTSRHPYPAPSSWQNRGHRGVAPPHAERNDDGHVPNGQRSRSCCPAVPAPIPPSWQNDGSPTHNDGNSSHQPANSPRRCATLHRDNPSAPDDPAVLPNEGRTRVGLGNPVGRSACVCLRMRL